MRSSNLKTPILLVILLVWALASTAYSAYLTYDKKRLEARIAYLEGELSEKLHQLESLTSNVTTLKGELERIKGVLEEKIVLVNILIDYGNGTAKWYNNTEVLKGSTLLEATMKIAKVDGETGKYGFYVKAINGHSEEIVSSSEGYSWIWYYWDGKEWIMGPVACDAQEVVDGGVYMWRYEHWKF